MRNATLAALFATLALLAAPAPAQEQTFTPTEANNPETCKELWEGIGLPAYARESEHDAIPVCHSRYVLSYNNEARTPDWVLEHITPEQISGKHKRPQMKFQPEPNVSKGSAAKDADYRGSGFDRGHQAPSADFSGKVEWMVESFFLSNIVPQVGKGFNRNIWKNFEDLVRDVVNERGEIYVITGPVYRDEDSKVRVVTTKENACKNEIRLEGPTKTEICAAKNKNSQAKCEAPVAVPVAMFKIIYDPKLKRATAYLMPNKNHGAVKDTLGYLKQYQVSLNVIEHETGFRFFETLSKRERRMLSANCGAPMLR